MLQLFVLRHGKATKYQDDRSDFDRKLNKQGTAQVNVLGKQLKEMNVYFDLIIHSSASRTAETAHIMAFHVNHEKILSDTSLYLTDKKTILTKIISESKGKCILYVGHNNGISDFVSAMLDQNKLLATSELIELKFETENWNEISFGTAYQGINIKPDVLSF